MMTVGFHSNDPATL
jgi:hypothetical protein